MLTRPARCWSTISWANFELQLRREGLCCWTFGSLPWSKSSRPVTCSCQLAPWALAALFHRSSVWDLLRLWNSSWCCHLANILRLNELVLPLCVPPTPNQNAEPAEKQGRGAVILKLHYLLTGTVPLCDSPQCWSVTAGTNKGTSTRAEGRNRCLVEGRIASFREPLCLSVCGMVTCPRYGNATMPPSLW